MENDEDDRRVSDLKIPPLVLVAIFGLGSGGTMSWITNKVSPVEERIQKQIDGIIIEMREGKSREHDEIFECKWELINLKEKVERYHEHK